MEESDPREEIKEISPTPSPIKLLIKNQNKSNDISCDRTKKIKQGSIINKTKFSQVK